MFASFSSFTLKLAWLVTWEIFSLSLLNLSKTTRRVFIFSWSAFFLLASASLSSFALVLAWLVASIAWALSDLILSSSERRKTVVAWRSLIFLELFSFKALSTLMLASLSSFAWELIWLIAVSTAWALLDWILSSSERRETVVAWRFLICVELFSFKALSILMLASSSSFAWELAWLVASITLALSSFIRFSSERKEAVVIWRSFICLELFCFILSNFLLLASLSFFAIALAWLVASITLALSVLIRSSSNRREAVVTWRP